LNGILPLIEEYNKLSSVSSVQEGYGEYLVYEDHDTFLTEQAYKDVFKIFSTHLYNPEIDIETESLTTALSEKIKAIYPSFNILFIPRTLYDLFFVIASIEEEKNSNCPMLCPIPSEFGLNVNEKYKTAVRDICWHLIQSTDEAPITSDDPTLIHLAFRFNQYCLKKIHDHLGYQGSSLSGKEIVSLTENQIDLLKKHPREFNAKYAFNNYQLYKPARGVALNFGLSTISNENIKSYSMRIKDNRDAQILRNAIARECSEVAKKALIFYRAGYLKEETRLNKDIKNTTLSYGTSLLAGCARDGTANVLYYTLEGKEFRRDAYAVVVPFNQWINAPYTTPRHMSLALVQLLARGERFHGHSLMPYSKRKIIKKMDYIFSSNPELIEGLENKLLISGISGGISQEELKYLATELSAERLANILNEFHKNAYVLHNAEFII
jgi:hypothetical protein